MIKKYLLTIATVMLLAVGCGDGSSNNGNNTNGGTTGGNTGGDTGGNTGGDTGTPVASYTIADDGTWLINTAQGLREFASTAGLSANAKLMNDINLEGNADNADTHWTAIGKDDLNPYTGTFDGDNKTISGLYIETNTSHQGLFGYVNGGTIKNLIISEPTIKGGNIVGGVVGDNYGTVENVKVIGGTITGEFHIGGIVGSTEGIITASYNTSTVNGAERVGGIVGSTNEGTVIASYNTGAVSGTTDRVGGIVGFNSSGSTVTASYNTGAIGGTASSVGGVVGENNDSTVIASYNTGNVESRNIDGYAGGIVGINNSGVVTAVYNTGEVNSPMHHGGVVGSNYGTVDTAYFTTSNNDGINGIGFGTIVGDEWTTIIVNGVTDIAELNTKVKELSDALALVGYNYIFVAGVNGASPTIQANEMCINPANDIVENTETTPSTWEIYTAKGLRDFASTAGSSANAKLMCNINLNGSYSNQWTPIGKDDLNSYTGTFDGDNKTISGLYIASSENYQGLFGAVDGGTIKNLTISNPYVKGNYFVGGVASSNNGTIENVAVVGGTITGGHNVGGIVGNNHGTVANVHNTSTVTGTGYNAGGVVGQNIGTVIASYNTGTVTSTGNTVGGIAGNNENGKIVAVYNTGEVSGGDNIGGIAGSNSSDAAIVAVYNTGNVTGDNNVGGVVGYHDRSEIDFAYFIFDKVVNGKGIGNSDYHGSTVFPVFDIENTISRELNVAIDKVVNNGTVNNGTVNTNYRFDENDVSKFVLLP